MSSHLKSRKALHSPKTTYARLMSVKGSVQKINLVADLIRNKAVHEAVLQLTFSKKRVAKELLALLKSAVSNAENNKMLDIDKLDVSEVLVGKSFLLKRLHARARGRAGRVVKPFSNVSIFVTERGN